MTLSGRVSVVVPFLNAALFLREAIESVVAQTYGKWELLLVDDGSSDGSSEIAGEYAARFRRRVARLAHPDGGSRGPAAARNLALGAARGDFIAFLDADDVWSPQKLERQTSIMATHPHVGMLYGTSCWWYSWAGEEEDGRRDRVEPLGVPAWVAFPPRSLLRPYFVLQHAAIPNPTSILLRRSVIETVGGFDESVPDGHEDQALYAKVCVHTTILAADECWDRYRQHPSSLTASVTAQGAEAAARVRFLTWLIRYLREHGVDDGIQAELRRQRFRYAHPRLHRVAARAARA